MKTPAPLPAVEHYEALRRSAVALAGERIFSAEPLGAILVVKTGVAGWMRHWRDAAGVTARPAAAPAPSSPTICDTQDWQHELTLLLAQMSFQRLSVSESQS
jgi:hypothetical protein